MSAIIISAFPGTGKSWIHENNSISKNLKILDSDSSEYSWEGDPSNKIRNKDFPANYIKHIKEESRHFDIIFVSSHKTVREALNENKIAYLLFYPDISLKNEYAERYKSRGNSPEFINTVMENWENWIGELESQRHMYCVTRICMDKGKFLSDYIGGREDGRESCN